jgi:hypothetical protein
MDAMCEVIDKIDGDEIPQLVIVDESVSTAFVRELAKRGKRNGNSMIREGIIPIHIGHGGIGQGMSDSEIVEFGKSIGCPYILTHDTHFYRFKKSYEKGPEGYGKIIVLRQMDSTYNYLRIVKKAGIRISGSGMSRVRSFG